MSSAIRKVGGAGLMQGRPGGAMWTDPMMHMRAWAFGVMASVPELGVGLTATATLLTSRHEKST